MSVMRAAAIFLLFAGLTAQAGDLEGVWKLTSGEYVNGEGELVNYQSVDLKSLKLISETHFSFTSMKGDEFWASGSGTYVFSDGKYSETLQHNSFGEKPGKVYSFNSKVEGDYWYNSRWEGDKRVEYEVWQRVE